MGVIVALTLLRDSVAAEITAIVNDLRDKNPDASFLTAVPRIVSVCHVVTALSVAFVIDHTSR